MKFIRIILYKIGGLLYKCFYLFSACTLVLFMGVILIWLLGMLDIHGTKQDIIVWVYVTVISIYTLTKVFLWLRKTFVALRAFYMKLFHKSKPESDTM